ncbi:MAG: hypothetical protein PWQ88_873 [Candidatus Methanomethylophilaceae archaeon]|nr:hypothetical protein [Candidatus Methanomethylophilaceae archaeon]MDI3541999.1 hypothetical protein [Candidatus Methanomethylophilaceae archaeon]HIJ00464.1 universal stress protein [Candidatus Methanomethylophilaceae archaeon]
MVFKKILIPTDGSDYTRPAVKKGLMLAKALGSKVTALYIMDQTAFINIPMDAATLNIYSLLEQEGKEAVEYVKNMGDEMGVDVEVQIDEGSPSKKITDASKDYDLIVMGTLGRTGVSKLLMGSVAEKVVRHANCPVMVVRAKEDVV